MFFKVNIPTIYDIRTIELASDAIEEMFPLQWQLLMDHEKRTVYGQLLLMEIVNVIISEMRLQNLMMTLRKLVKHIFFEKYF